MGIETVNLSSLILWQRLVYRYHSNWQHRQCHQTCLLPHHKKLQCICSIRTILVCLILYSVVPVYIYILASLKYILPNHWVNEENQPSNTIISLFIFLSFEYRCGSEWHIWSLGRHNGDYFKHLCDQRKEGKVMSYTVQY